MYHEDILKISGFECSFCMKAILLDSTSHPLCLLAISFCIWKWDIPMEKLDCCYKPLQHSGWCGAPVRTRQADLNKSETQCPAQPAKEHHDLSITIIAYQHYSFRNKRQFNTGYIFQKVINPGLWDHQFPQHRPNTKCSVATVWLKWSALRSKLQILLFIPDWTSALLSSVFLCQSITVMLYPTITVSNVINSWNLLSHETI